MNNSNIFLMILRSLTTFNFLIPLPHIPIAFVFDAEIAQLYT
jgi:hypothetical protein